MERLSSFLCPTRARPCPYGRGKRPYPKGAHALRRRHGCRSHCRRPMGRLVDARPVRAGGAQPRHARVAHARLPVPGGLGGRHPALHPHRDRRRGGDLRRADEPHARLARDPRGHGGHALPRQGRGGRGWANGDRAGGLHSAGGSRPRARRPEPADRDARAARVRHGHHERADERGDHPPRPIGARPAHGLAEPHRSRVAARRDRAAGAADRRRGLAGGGGPRPLQAGQRHVRPRSGRRRPARRGLRDAKGAAQLRARLSDRRGGVPAAAPRPRDRGRRRDRGAAPACRCAGAARRARADAVGRRGQRLRGRASRTRASSAWPTRLSSRPSARAATASVAAG